MFPLRLLIALGSEDAAKRVEAALGEAFDLTACRVTGSDAVVRALAESWNVAVACVDGPGALSPDEVLPALARVGCPCIVVSDDASVVAAWVRAGAKDYVATNDAERLRFAVERERARTAECGDLLEQMPYGVIVHRDDEILYANEEARRILLATGPLAGMRLRQLAADPSNVEPSPLSRVNPKPTLTEERFLRHDGSFVDVDVTATEVTFGGRQAVLTVVREASLRRDLTASLMQMDRMIAVGTLAAGVGHEINNPLAYVLANVEYVQVEVARAVEELGSTPPRVLDASERLSATREVLAEALEGGHRIRDIVQDLRTFSRDDEVVAPVDVRPLLNAAIRMAAGEFKHRARVVKQLDDVPLVEANGSRLGQVFLNLLVNAAQAIPTDGLDAHEIRVCSRVEDGRVIVTVADTGVGIAPENLPRIFAPFFTTKPVGEGTGLGLAICHAIVTGMGGTIQVKSEPGRGTEFRLALPISCSESPRPTATSEKVALRGRVLFVDDEALLGEAVRRFLGREHEVVVVPSAGQAMAVLGQRRDFDAIFVDLMMPEVSGAMLFEMVEATYPELVGRVIFMSGGEPSPKDAHALARAQRPPLFKPFEMGNVTEIVGRMVAERGSSDDG